MDHNPGIIIAPLEYVNAAETIAKNENMISIAHPDFRDELIKEADKQKIWIRSMKR